MEGTVICVTWTWWLVAASALIITLVGHYYQIAIMTGCGCPPAGDRGDHDHYDQPPLQQVRYKYFVIVGFPVIRFPQRAK